MTRTLYAKQCQYCGIRYPFEPGKITHQCGGNHAKRICATSKTVPDGHGPLEAPGTTAAGNHKQSKIQGRYKMKRRPPTVKQAEYLRQLCEQLGYDYGQYDLSQLRMEEVSLIISELKEELG